MLRLVAVFCRTRGGGFWKAESTAEAASGESVAAWSRLVTRVPKGAPEGAVAGHGDVSGGYNETPETRSMFCILFSGTPRLAPVHRSTRLL